MAKNAVDIDQVVGLIQALAPAMDVGAIQTAVTSWLNNHPEATTTVTDGSITETKLATTVAQKLGLISSLSDEIDGVKSAIAYTNETSGYRVNVEWESGAINGTTGEESENANYSRTADYISTANADYVDMPGDAATLIFYNYESNAYVRKASKYVNRQSWPIDKQYGYFRISGGMKIANHPENTYLIYKYTKAQKDVNAAKLTIIGKYKAPVYMGDGNVISWEQYSSNTTLTMPHDTHIIFEGYTGAENYIYTNDVFTVAQSASETTVDGDTITGNNFAIIYNISTGAISITSASTYKHADINEVVLFEVAWASFVSGLLVDYVIRRKYESNIKRLEAVESVVNSGTHLPDYWLTYLETKISDVQDKDIEIGNHGDGFIWVTDLHYNTNDGNSAGACEYKIEKSSVNNVIIGGDICNGSNDGKSACFKQILNCRDAYRPINPFYLRGNHDNNTEISSPSEGKAISDSELYGIILKPIEDKIVNPDKALHYYFDNEVQKIRYICLDTGHPDTNVISDAQITWMQGIITELASGWTVVVLTHQYYSNAAQLTRDDNGDKILAGLNAIYDSANATIACVICGHSHRDVLETTAKGFPVICTTCDVRGGESGSLTRTAGTYTEQAFDVFHIDTTARKIYATRIGAGSDRETTY